MKKIVIVNYGINNLGSLRRAVALYAPEVMVSEEPEAIESADAILLPGVGSLAAGMEGLRVRGLVEPLRAAAKRGVPILGICLGAQLLLAKGYEFGEHEGLGLIAGEVRPFPQLPQGTVVPAIGWQRVSPGDTAQAQSLFAGLGQPDMYFVHSYACIPEDPKAVIATTTYGGHTYAAAIGEGTIYGTQFHPEKSGPAGLTLIQNFIISIA